MSSDESEISREKQQSPDNLTGKGKTGEWRMPTPKFQQTSGYLPKGYAATAMRKFSPSAEQAAPPQTAAGEQMPLPPVEPQPDIYEQLSTNPPESIHSPVENSRTEKPGVDWIYVILGIGLMLVALAAFIVIVYVLFIAPAGNDGPF
jgi:hypothetical protein